MFKLQLFSALSNLQVILRLLFLYFMVISKLAIVLLLFHSPISHATVTVAIHYIYYSSNNKKRNYSPNTKLFSFTFALFFFYRVAKRGNNLQHVMLLITGLQKGQKGIFEQINILFLISKQGDRPAAVLSFIIQQLPCVLSSHI